MFPYLARVWHAFFKDELAFRRWMRGGLFFFAAIAGQLVADPKWSTWTFREWVVHLIPAVILFVGGSMQSSAKKPEMPPAPQLRGFIRPQTAFLLVFLLGALFALALLFGIWGARKAFGAVVQRPTFGFVVLCKDGGVVARDGSLGSGGLCVVMDRNGGKAFADSVSVYDNALGGP